MKVFICISVCDMRNRNFTLPRTIKDMFLLTSLLSFLVACSGDFKSVKYIGLEREGEIGSGYGVFDRIYTF